MSVNSVRLAEGQLWVHELADHESMLFVTISKIKGTLCEYIEYRQDKPNSLLVRTIHISHMKNWCTYDQTRLLSDA